MSLGYKAAISAAGAFSALSLYDAVHHGITGHGSVFSDEHGTTWATIAMGLLAAVTFAALSVVLVQGSARIDAGNRVRGWIRRILAVDLVALAAVFAVGTPFLGGDSALANVLGAVAGVTFAALFALAFALGLAIVRVPGLRASAVLLVSMVPVIGLTVALQALAPDFAHPAYTETAVYLGIALLGRRPALATSSAPLASVAHATP
jgi:hypothetical protein